MAPHISLRLALTNDSAFLDALNEEGLDVSISFLKGCVRVCSLNMPQQTTIILLSVHLSRCGAVKIDSRINEAVFTDSFVYLDALNKSFPLMYFVTDIDTAAVSSLLHIEDRVIYSHCTVYEDSFTTSDEEDVLFVLQVCLFVTKCLCVMFGVACFCPADKAIPLISATNQRCHL